jgi:hypothetical protein
LAANPKKEFSMEDTVKKTKATAKPRKAATPKKKSSEVAQMPNPKPTREEIEQLARNYWVQRGYQDGYAEQDWLRAEQELRGMAS